jgi:Cft2 family RNA processing exonuclease
MFNPSDYEKKKTPEQKQFIENNLDFLIAFKEIIYDSHQDLHEIIFPLFKPGEMDNNMPAVSMISFIRKRLLRQFPLYCEKATTTRFKLLTPSNEYLFVKKLDDDKKPQNIRTVTNEKILNQCLEKNEDSNPNVFIGYSSTEKCDSITGVYAVCIKGEETLWIIDINTLSSGIQGIIVDMDPKDLTPKLKEGIVKIKKANE